MITRTRKLTDKAVIDLFVKIADAVPNVQFKGEYGGGVPFNASTKAQLRKIAGNADERIIDYMKAYLQEGSSDYV